MEGFRLWPRSLQGQVLLAIALALLVAQTISATLIWREQKHRREMSMVSSAAFRLIGPTPEERRRSRHDKEDRPPPVFRIEHTAKGLHQPGEKRLPRVEHELAEVLSAQGVDAAQVVVFERDPLKDGPSLEFWERNRRKLELVSKEPMPRLVIASIQSRAGGWTSTRVFTDGGEMLVIAPLVGQTIVLYLVLVGAMALILRRMVRPLKALTRRVEDFAGNRAIEGQLQPEGPEDIRGLIVAHNAMEARIAAMLNEKDVMLGAIGHDLKTPLAALRVRIEAVEDDTERGRMAATIEDINRSLDDILSLARVGRPTDPVEPTELSALVADVIGEFEDMGEPVELGDTRRIAVPLRATWVRRALRNLIGNALRYGRTARVSVDREGDFAVVRIDDDGPGIADADIARMLEPFARGEPSRNTETGGTGIGLTLARAVAEQDGGTLRLANRRDAQGRIEGLTATLRLPLH